MQIRRLVENIVIATLHLHPARRDGHQPQHNLCAAGVLEAAHSLRKPSKRVAVLCFWYACVLVSTAGRQYRVLLVWLQV